MVTRSDLRQHDVPIVVQKYRVRYLKASPWVGARPVLGTAPTVPRVGALAFFGEEGTPVSLPLPCLLQGSIQHATGAWGKGPVRLDRGPLWPASYQPRLGLLSQRESWFRSDAAPLLLSRSVG